jgi:hypothetical protein
MACVECHTGDEMHGMDMTATHRYDGEPQPACISCHQDQVGVGSGIEQHEIHGTETLSCYACHSTSYTSCDNCHVQRTEEGIAFYSIEDHYMTFMLGRNVLRSADRPWEYVPLRHVPIDINSFDFYGDNLLPTFDNVPTWAYASPHNIQRNTPQTESCDSCHGNDDIFLTIDKVAPEEVEANRDVMVEGAPPMPDGYTQPAISEEPTESSGDDFWGGNDAATPTEAPDDFWGGSEEPTEEASDDFWGGSETTPEPQTTEEESPDDFWGND